jgi:hypothetical protein
MSVSRPHPPAFVAGNCAPLTGERAATRGRSATESGDERAGVKKALSVRAPASRTGSNGENRGPLAGIRPTEARRHSRPAGSRRSLRQRTTPKRPRRATRPGTRTLMDDLPAVRGRAGRRHVGTPPPDLEINGGWLSASRPHLSAAVVGNDAPLIGEHAATRGRIAVEGGDERPARKGFYLFALQPREPDRLAGTSACWRPCGRRSLTYPSAARRALHARLATPIGSISWKH